MTIKVRSKDKKLVIGEADLQEGEAVTNGAPEGGVANGGNAMKNAPRISVGPNGANGAKGSNGSAVKTKPQAKPSTTSSNGNGHKPMPNVRVSAGTDPSANGDASTPKPRRARRIVVIATGSLIALGIGFAVAFVVLGVLDTSEAQVRDSLSNSNTTVDDSLSGVEDAANSDRPLTDLQSLAAGAADGASDIEQAEADLRGAVDDGRIVNPTLEVMGLEQGFLADFSTIAKFSDTELAQRWKHLEPKLAHTQRKINASGASVEALGLGGESPLVPESEELTAAIDSADAILTKSDRVLSKWRDAVAEAKQQKQQALELATGYQSSINGLIAEYSAARSETGALMDDPKVHWMDASDALRSQAETRGGIASSIDARARPAGAAGANGQLAAIVSEAAGMLNDAAYKIELVDIVPIWTGSPGYMELSARSDELTPRYESAKAAVLGAAAGAVEQAQAIELPPKPKL
jgi:hypothetical protein